MIILDAGTFLGTLLFPEIMDKITANFFFLNIITQLALGNFCDKNVIFKSIN